ncbi:MAG: heterodisulfide reductase-related iron-sulfur binding cluster [Gemmatimonadota bacterium]
MPDAGEAWVEDLLACVHCGFCLPACPTYDVLGEENDSPRGRLYLMRALAEGRLGTGGAFDLHIGRCLGCRACETACPAGVPYGSLLERARSRSAPRGARGVALRLLLALLTAGTASRAVYAVARLLRRTRAADLAARALPGRAGLAAGMLAATRQARRRSTSGPDRAGGTVGQGGTLGAEGTFALLEGCVMRGLYGHVHAATRRALRRRGRAERPAPGQACCGALHAHAGRLEAGRELARRNVAAFERSGAELVVSDAAGCGAALRDYPHWLRGDADWEERARAFAARVRDVSEILAPAGPGEPLQAATSAPAPGGPAIAYDAPCHLFHAQGVREAPLAAMAAAGLRATPLPSWERCCGGAGIYDLLQPELSADVLAPKLEEIASGGYGILATGNPGCAMFIGASLRRRGIAVSVAHPVELVDAAESAAERAGARAAERSGESSTERDQRRGPEWS